MSSENKLLEKAVKGDRKAQFELYQEYSSRMLVVCMRYSKKQEDAEDILQEGFIKVFKKLDTFRSESSLYSWIKRIMINTALNYHRSKFFDQPMVDVEQLYDLADGELILSDYNFKELLAMLQQLPHGCQVVFNLYAIEGFSHKEIAEKLGISVGTSKSQYSRAKTLLKEIIQEAEAISYERQEDK